MLKNKKGSLQDIIFMAVVLLVFGMILLIGYTITSEINDQIQNNDAIDSYGKEASTKLTNYYPGIIDNTYLFFAIGLSIVTLTLATLVVVHPIFMVFYFIGLIITIFVSGLFSNIYQEMAATTQLAPYAAGLVFTTNLLTYLPIIVTVVGILLMIVMYKIHQNVNQ